MTNICNQDLEFRKLGFNRGWESLAFVGGTDHRR
jgi:hypothetical protein